MRWLELCWQLLPAALFALGQVHTRSLYGIAPTAQYELTAGQVLSASLLFTAYSVKVDNPTPQWIHILNTLQYIPPQVTGYVVPIPSLDVAGAQFEAPAGVTQPSSVPNQQAVLTYYSYDLPPSGATLSVQLSSNVPGSLTVINAQAAPYNATGLGQADDGPAIRAALAALGANGGIVFLPPGTYRISSLDPNGNLLTLPTKGSMLWGAGRNATVISCQVNATWGIQLQAALSDVRDLQLQVPAGFTCTYGIGIDTPTSPGSAEGATFSNLMSQGVGGGTLTNAFAVGPGHAGQSNIDISNTLFFRCWAAKQANAGFLIGNGTSGNIVNTTLVGCAAQNGTYGVYANATDFRWLAGTDLANNTDSDFALVAFDSAAFEIDGVRSEGSARLVHTIGNASISANVRIRDVEYNAGSIVATGDFINYAWGGSLSLEGIRCSASGAVAPLILIGTPNGIPLAITVEGLMTSALLTQLFSWTPSQTVTAVVTGYTQLSATGGDPAVGATFGPVTLQGTTTTFSFNGTVRDVALPQPAQNSQTQPANPAGTTSTIGVMMGLSSGTTLITPKRSGVVMVTLSGDIFNATAIADGASVQLRWGTGNGPANGAALTGTAVGGKPQYVAATTAEKAPFSITVIISGLAIGTAIWLDAAVAAITGGTATIENLSLSAVEL